MSWVRSRLTAVGVGIAVMPGAALGPVQPAAASRWPGSVVTYRDSTGYPKEVRRAVALWNAAVTRPRLVPARRGRRAQIRVLPKLSPGSGNPLQAFGYYPPDGRVFMTLSWTRSSAAEPDDPYSWPRVNLAAHEIGHALGLPHVSGCRLMSGTALPRASPRGPCRAASRGLPESWALCGPQRADAAALARLYGGLVRSRKRFGACAPQRFGAPPAAVGELTAPAVPLWRAPRPRPPSVTITVRNTGSWAWGRTTPGSYGHGQDDVELRLLTPDPYLDCGPLLLPENFGIKYPTAATATYTRETFGSETVKPGASGQFGVPLCGATDVGERTVSLRLEATGPGGRTAGPVFQLAVRRDGPPEPSFTRAPASDSVAPGTPLQFTDTSTAPRGVAGRSWTFGDPDSGAGNASAEAAPSHTFAAAGGYEVVLTVRDTQGREASTSQWVTVTAPIEASAER